MANVSVWEADASVPAASVTGLTAGYICFGNTNGTITGESALFWDATNNRLGVGTASPVVDVHVERSNSGGGVTFHMANTSGTAGSDARMGAAVANGSGGDPYVLLSVAGTTDWLMGVDNSDSDTLKWDLSSVGGSTKMKLDTSGNLSATGIVYALGNSLYAGATGQGFVYGQIHSSATNNQTVDIRGTVSDGAAAIGLRFCNTNTLSTSGAKICSFYNDDRNTEQAYLKHNGVFGTTSASVANNAQTVTVGNVGPGSAGTSISKWLQWVEGGTTYVIPLFSYTP